jgi:hypothetical protein
MFETRGERDREIGKRGAKETDGKESGLWEKRGEERRGEEGREDMKKREREHESGLGKGGRGWGNGRSGKRRGGISAVWRMRDVYPGSRSLIFSVPDPGSRIHNKKEQGKNKLLVLPFFVENNLIFLTSTAKD